MVETVIRTVGREGDFPTLAAWARALPRDLVAAGEAHVAELLAGREDPGGAVIETVCDGRCHVTVRAAAGHGFAALMDPIGDALTPGSGLGAAVRAARGAALTVVGRATRLHLRGLQIVAEDGPAVADDGAGACETVTGCLIEAVSAEPAVSVRGPEGRIAATALVQRGPGDGVLLADGAAAAGCTLFKPVRPVAQGFGISVTGAPAPSVHSTAAFGFRQAFGPGIGAAAALVSDQMNYLPVPGDLAHPSWRRRGVTVDPGDRRPSPFGVPLMRLTAAEPSDARLEAPAFRGLRPGQRLAVSMVVAEPTALSSALSLESPAGRAELAVSWTDMPPATALIGQAEALAAVAGGLAELGGGLYRMWLTAENRTRADLDVTPVLSATRGIANAGLSLGLYAGAAMAGTGHLGTGFCGPSALPDPLGRAGVDPEAALCSASAILPDLRPVDGGPLDGAGRLSGPDILGQGRLVPDTVGALTVNPAPRFLGDMVTRPRRARRGPPLTRNAFGAS